MKKFLIAFAIAGIALLPGMSGAGATTEHCPDGGVKVEANGGTQAAINDLVLDAGVRVCVKGSTDATGIVVADGETSLKDILGSGHDVSYYVIYPALPTTTTTVPEVTTTTVPEVTTTTLAPVVPETPVTPEAPVTVAAPRTGVPVTAVPEAAPQLPRTGSNNSLALIGGLFLLLGGAAYGARKFLTN